MAVPEPLQLALYELRKNLRSKKGIAMIALFVLGGLVPSVGRILILRASRAAHIDDFSAEVQRRGFEKLLLSVYGGDQSIAEHISASPPVLWFLFQGTLMFAPLAVLLIGFDQIAGEVQYRSIRYIAGRAHRHSIVIGKALGVLGVIAAMMLVLHGVVWIVLIAGGDTGVGTTLSWGLRYWAFSVAFGAAYVGLMNLVSSWFKTPILALFVGAGAVFAMWLVRLILLAIGDKAEVVTWAFPSSYEQLMVSADPLRALGGCALAIAWGALLVGLSTEIVRRRDL